MIKRSSRRTLGVAVAGTLALVACGDDPLGPEPRDVEFAASLGIDLDNMTKTDSGMFFRDDVMGTGDPAEAGDSVTLTFTGWLSDGDQFDTGGFTFTLPGPTLIDGFNEGVTGMRAGGTRTIVLPADLAFGAQGQGSIPGDAVVVFEITVSDLVRP